MTSPDDPLIAAIIQKLPKGGKWCVADRVIWLTMATLAFDVVYGRDGDIEIGIMHLTKTRRAMHISG